MSEENEPPFSPESSDFSGPESSGKESSSTEALSRPGLRSGQGGETSSRDPLDVDALIRENLPWLRGWLGARLRGHRRQDVDDICQEILMKAVRSLDQLRDTERFSAWLFQIASNGLRDYLRQQKRRQKESIGLEIDVPESSTSMPVPDRDDELHRVLGAVVDLPEKYREPMILRHVENLPYDTISEILGITKNNVQVRIFRGRQMLREALTAAERVHPSGDPAA